jgi:hypothetical protein
LAALVLRNSVLVVYDHQFAVAGKTLGLAMPHTLLLSADQLIE